MNFDQQEKQASLKPLDPTGVQRYRTPVGKVLLTRWLYDCARWLATLNEKGSNK